MTVKIPYGITCLQVGALYVYSLKLRFNAASWSWIEPEIETLTASSSLIAISKHNDYYTVQFQTTQYEQFNLVRGLINRGQVAQQKELLSMWEEHGYRPDARLVHRTQLSVEL